MKTILMLALSLALVGCGAIRPLPQDRTTMTLPRTGGCANSPESKTVNGVEVFGHSRAVVKTCVASK